jgi:hypothetical protein
MSAIGSSISAGNVPARQVDADEKAVLILLFEDRYPWKVEELTRELNHPTDAVDAIASLAGDGLVHRLGDFVFPTRAARRSDELYEGAL